MDLWTPPFSRGTDSLSPENRLYYITKDIIWMRRMKELAPRLYKDIGFAMQWDQFEVNLKKLHDALGSTGTLVMRQWRNDGKIPSMCRGKHFFVDYWFPHYTRIGKSYHVRDYCCLVCRELSDMTYSCLNPSQDNIRIFEHGAVYMCEGCYNYGLTLNYNSNTMRFSVPKTYDELRK